MGKEILTRSYLIRVILVFASNFMAGLGLALLRLSCLGTDPASAFCYNLSEMFGLPLVVFLVSMHLILMFILFSGMKRFVGIGMVANMVVYGIAADYWKALILRILPLRDDYVGLEELPVRLVLMIAGLFILVFFIAFYIASDTGVSPYDGFAYELERRIPKVPYKVWRILQDGTFLVLAFIVGTIKGNPWTVIGIATLVMVFFIGPVISIVREKLADPLYQKIG